MLHDPDWWRYGWTIGTSEYATIHKGNLVGGKEIRVEGGQAPCDTYGDFGEERKVFLDGEVVEYSQGGAPCVRRHDVSRTYTPADMDQVYSRDVGVDATWNNGFVTDITYTGGDPDSTDPNASGNSGITYREVRTHQAGVLKTRKYDGVSWYSLDRDVDVATALTAVSRNSAGVPTTFGYDDLGRRTLTAPQAPEHPTAVTYPVETGLGGLHKFSRVTETRTGPPGDPGEIYSRQERDGLGRVVREIRMIDDGGTVVKDYAYDGLGALTFESEWHDPNAPAPLPGTSYDYITWNWAFPPVGLRDPFSRPWKITDASGAVVKITHFGVNESRRVDHINLEPTNPNPGAPAVTDVYRDYRGNVRIVNAPEGADAIYDYDASGRLTGVDLVGSFVWKPFDPVDPNDEGLKDNRFAVLPAAGTARQTRSREYDPLGRLRKSTDPESGDTVYHAYDPMDRVMIFEEAPTPPAMRGRAERHSFDPAGRLVELRATADASNGFADPGSLRLSNAYANAAGSFPLHGQALSRLVRSETFEGLPETPGVEREIYYSGLGGRVSEERIRNEAWPRDPNASPEPPWVSMGYTHDAYGQLAKLTYPLPEGSQRAATEVEYVYAHGFLDRVRSNKATLDPEVFTDLATAAYDERGLLESLSFQNGVVESYSSDVLGRTASIQFTKGANTLWSRIGYRYDGVGNLIGMGSQESFGYDNIGRLRTAATLATDGAVHQQSYFYDAFGSMT
jgi:hypothetical protein